MSRTFVNGLANFIVEGNLVSFTLTDQRTDGGGKPLGPAQPVSDVVMRLSDFTQMAQYLAEAGKEISRKQGGQAPVMPRPSAKAPAAQPPRAKPVAPNSRPPIGTKLTPGR